MKLPKAATRNSRSGSGAPAGHNRLPAPGQDRLTVLAWFAAPDRTIACCPRRRLRKCRLGWRQLLSADRIWSGLRQPVEQVPQAPIDVVDVEGRGLQVWHLFGARDTKLMLSTGVLVPDITSEWRMKEPEMYIARFSYDLLPSNRQKGVAFIRREVEAARAKGLSAKLLVPITRAHDGAALQFEIELTSLDQLDQFRQRGFSSNEETGHWMHAFSEILQSPPTVEILRLDDAQSG
jgi:hypothetical protein